jgi:hypothetical protein
MTLQERADMLCDRLMAWGLPELVAIRTAELIAVAGRLRLCPACDGHAPGECDDCGHTVGTRDRADDLYDLITKHE